MSLSTNRNFSDSFLVVSRTRLVSDGFRSPNVFPTQVAKKHARTAFNRTWFVFNNIDYSSCVVDDDRNEKLMADQTSVDSNESAGTSDEYEIVPSNALNVKFPSPLHRQTEIDNLDRILFRNFVAMVDPSWILAATATWSTCKNASARYWTKRMNP